MAFSDAYVWTGADPGPDFPVGFMYGYFKPYSTGSAQVVLNNGNHLSSRAWWIRDGAATFSTNHATHAAYMTGFECRYLPRRQRISFSRNSLSFAQSDLPSRDNGVIVSRLRVTNGDVVQRTVSVYPRISLGYARGGTMSGGIAQIATSNTTNSEGAYFFGSVPGASSWDLYAAAASAPAGEYTSPTSIAAATDTCLVGKVTLTIPAGESRDAFMVWFVANDAIPSITTDAAAWIAALTAQNLTTWFDAEEATIDGWGDKLAVTTPNAKINNQIRYSIANVIGARTRHWWDRPNFTKRGHWHGAGQLSYNFIRLHQVYPMQYVELAIGEYAIVKDELRWFASFQAASGQIAQDASYREASGYKPYSSTYVELMWVLCLHQYLSFSQDFAFLDESVGGTTILDRARSALAFVHSNLTAGGDVSGCDWHDGWGIDADWALAAGSPGNAVFQGGCTFVMAARKLAEIEEHEGGSGATYTGWADIMTTRLTSSFWWDSANSLYRRFRLADGTFLFSTPTSLLVDGHIWAILSGVSTDPGILAAVRSRRAAPLNAIRVSNGQGEGYAEGYLYEPWPEKFFEWAKAEAIVGNGLEAYNSFVSPVDAPTEGRISYYPERTGQAAYTWSADGEIVRWAVERLIGLVVKLDGSVDQQTNVVAGSASVLIGGREVALDTALGVVLPLPGTLPPGDATSCTGTISGSDIALNDGEYIGWNVNAGSGGPFRLDCTTSGAGTIAVSVDGTALGEPDPLLLPVASGDTQAPLVSAYNALAVASLPVGGSYLDPTTGVKIYRLTASGFPGPAGVSYGHDYADGGHEVSLPHTGDTRTILVRSPSEGGGDHYLIDFTPGSPATVTNARKLTTYRPTRDTTWTFSCNATTPHYAWVAVGGQIHRVDVRGGAQPTNADDSVIWPVSLASPFWLQQSQDDGFFAWMDGNGGTSPVYGYDPATGTSKSRTFTGLNEPRIDRAGRYIAVSVDQPQNERQVWDWLNDTATGIMDGVPRTSPDVNGLPFAHIAAMRNGWLGVDWNCYTGGSYSTGARWAQYHSTDTAGGEPFGSWAPGTAVHGSGNWVQPDAATDDQWAIFSHYGSLTPGTNGGAWRWLAPGGMVFVTRSGQRRLLGHSYNTAASYDYFSFVKPSPDGRYVLFTSNMNGQARSDLFLAEMPVG